MSRMSSRGGFEIRKSVPPYNEQDKNFSSEQVVTQSSLKTATLQSKISKYKFAVGFFKHPLAVVAKLNLKSHIG